jgi:uncharacterized membrane protein YeiH
MLFEAMDLGATFVFAISGATQAVRRRFDLFGVMVVAWAAGVSGGVARDLLIGAVPPAAVANWHDLAATVAAGLVGFFASDLIAEAAHPGAAVRCRRALPVRRDRHREDAELYAVAALAGAGSVSLGPALPANALLGAGLCLFLRLMSIYRGRHLPIARVHRQSFKRTD